MDDNKKFMLRAIELSIESASSDGGPFGCVIVKDSKIIAEGSNKVTSLKDPPSILNTFIPIHSPEITISSFPSPSRSPIATSVTIPTVSNDGTKDTSNELSP